MLTIGITGGIGSGKSTVVSFLQQLMEPGTMDVLLMDDVAKSLMNTDERIRQDLIAAFGTDVYDDGGRGSLNRQRMASIVFGSSENVEKINSIVHPRVFEYTSRKAKELAEAGFKMLLIETALLFSTKSHERNDVNVLVSAPQELRVERAMTRSAVPLSRDQVLARMSHQTDWDQVAHLAHYILDNSTSDEGELRRSVAHLKEFLLDRWQQKQRAMIAVS